MCPKVGMQRCFCVVGVCNASLMFMAAMLRTAWKCFCAFPNQISFVELCAEWGLSEAVWLTSRRKDETAWAPKAFRQVSVVAQETCIVSKSWLLRWLRLAVCDLLHHHLAPLLQSHDFFATGIPFGHLLRLLLWLHYTVCLCRYLAAL